jgi:hypothetical protein
VSWWTVGMVTGLVNFSVMMSGQNRGVALVFRYSHCMEPSFFHLEKGMHEGLWPGIFESFSGANLGLGHGKACFRGKGEGLWIWSTELNGVKVQVKESSAHVAASPFCWINTVRHDINKHVFSHKHFTWSSAHTCEYDGSAQIKKRETKLYLSWQTFWCKS